MRERSSEEEKVERDGKDWRTCVCVCVFVSRLTHECLSVCLTLYGGRIETFYKQV